MGITLVEVETLQDVRLNGKEIAAGEMVSVTQEVKNIWLKKGLCKLPGQDEDLKIPGPPEVPETAETTENNPIEFPKYIPVGKWQLSNGEIFTGKKEAAIEAENALKG